VPVAHSLPQSHHFSFEFVAADKELRLLSGCLLPGTAPAAVRQQIRQVKL
jgi:hypothetical protein